VRKNRGIRTGRYKLIHYYEQPEEFELYDLQEDPGASQPVREPWVRGFDKRSAEPHGAASTKETGDKA